MLAYHHHLMMLVEKPKRLPLFATPQRIRLASARYRPCDRGWRRLRRDLRRFGSRIVHIHLKDVRRNVLKRILESDASFNSGVRGRMFHSSRRRGCGLLRVGRFVRNSGYRGWVIVEAEQDPAKAPRRCMRKRRIALRRT